MANRVKLGKRERQLVKLAEATLTDKMQAPKRYAADMSEPWQRSRKGAAGDADYMRGRTHSNAHVAGAAYGVKTIYPGTVSLGRVEDGGTWRKQAPLPNMTRDQLLALDRGHKVAPLDSAPTPAKPVSRLAPTTSRHAKLDAYEAEARATARDRKIAEEAEKAWEKAMARKIRR